MKLTLTPERIIDEERYVEAIIGDLGGVSAITGSVEYSSIVPGTVVFETEHGALYIPSDQEIQLYA